MAVIATDQCTLSVAVDVESVETWYMQVAASANAPAKPTVADPSSLGWTTTEPGFDAQNSKKLYTCQKTTLTDGTFMWGAVQLSSSYTGASTALNTANAAANAASNAEKVATNYITAITGNGIWVTPSDAKPSAQGAATVNTSGWHISDAIELFRQGVSHIKMWVENSVAKLRLGAANSTHVLIDSDSLDIEDGSSNVLATFGATSRIGKADESHLEMDYHSMQLVSREGSSYMHVSDLRGSDGLATVEERIDLGQGDSLSSVNLTFFASSIVSLTLDDGEYNVTAYTSSKVPAIGWYITRLNITGYELANDPGEDMTPTVDPSIVNVVYKTENENVKVFTFGKRRQGYGVGPFSYVFGNECAASSFLSRAEGSSTIASGVVSHAEGEITTASGRAAHSEGQRTTASGVSSHAEGEGTKASYHYAHSEGSGTIASGLGAHAEGSDATASGSYSHAEGQSSTASGYGSHAEGTSSTASGDESHAEGLYSKSAGACSHAQNTGTIAKGDNQTALGKYNVQDDSGTYAVIVGNGTYDENRSNALTVDWSGNVMAAGSITFSGGTLGSAATHAHGDYALAGHTHSYLPLSGGNLTGNLGVKSVLTLGSNTTAEENGIKLKGGGTRNGWVLRTISAANGDGDAVLLGDGGMTIVGGGEAAANLWTALGVSAGDEQLHLASDNGVHIHTNCQTIANRQTVDITANGSIIGPNNHVVKLAGVDSSASDNGVTTTTYRYHSFIDESDRYIGWLGTTVGTEGNITTTVAARRRNGSANFDNMLSLGVTKDGKRTVAFSDKQPWRDALGFNTWTNVAISDFATAASGWSFVTNDCLIQYNEALGALRCRIRLTTSAAQTAGQKTVFTVAAAYRPKTLSASLSSLVSNAQAIQIYTNGSGAVNVSALSASASLYFNGVYFIGA